MRTYKKHFNENGENQVIYNLTDCANRIITTYKHLEKSDFFDIGFFNKRKKKNILKELKNTLQTILNIEQEVSHHLKNGSIADKSR